MKYRGFSTPLLSTRSLSQDALGTYSDIMQLVDVAVALKLNIVQLLPLNDTGFDPSPYNPISIIALHPVYINIAKLTNSFHEETKYEIAIKSHRKKTHIPFKKIYIQKLKCLFSYIEKNFHTYLKNQEYREFILQNKWLKSYGEYLTLHVNEYRKCSIEFINILQFICFCQLKEASIYAKANSIELMTDIPILVSPLSVEAATHPEYFNKDYNVGAPHDTMFPNGQDWGFPSFNWSAIEKSKYRLWNERLSYAEKFFSHYRIDHCIGFFRLYCKKNNIGSFYPPEMSKALSSGIRNLLSIVKLTTMKPVAEDLGIVPHEVRNWLISNNIPITYVLPFAMQYITNSKWIHCREYNPVSVATLSTHDTMLLGEWWSMEKEEASKIATSLGFTYKKNISIEDRKKICKILFSSPSRYIIPQLTEITQCIDSLKVNDKACRINIPGTLSSTNWTYRHSFTTDDIIRNREALLEITT